MSDDDGDLVIVCFLMFAMLLLGIMTFLVFKVFTGM